MKVIAISSNSEGAGAHVAEEARAVEDLTNRGVVTWVLLKTDWSGAVMLLDVPDLETARQTVTALPIAARGLTRFELIPVTEPPDQVAGTAP